VAEDKLRGCNKKNPITTSLFIFMKIIQEKDPLSLAVDCLFLAACVDSKDVPLNLVKAYSPRIDTAVQVFSKYKLVTRRPAESAFDLYCLVHLALRE
jgi:hypothetical protein